MTTSSRVKWGKQKVVKAYPRNGRENKHPTHAFSTLIAHKHRHNTNTNITQQLDCCQLFQAKAGSCGYITATCEGLPKKGTQCLKISPWTYQHTKGRNKLIGSRMREMYPNSGADKVTLKWQCKQEMGEFGLLLHKTHACNLSPSDPKHVHESNSV